MSRILMISIILFSFLAVAQAQSAQQDYTDQLLKLYQLIDSKQYREAIGGFKSWQAQPGTPEWLKAAFEYETAELYGTLDETDNAVAAFSRAVQLGFDDCLTPRADDRLGPILNNSRAAAQALSRMKIAENDFRELVWLKSEVLYTRHDSSMMIIENTNRLDTQITEIHQSQLPKRQTASSGVLYWRQLLLLVQKIQRDFVQKADLARMKHATNMAIISGGLSPSVVLESARRARAAAESRKAEIRKRAFVPAATSSDVPKPCTDYAASLR